MRGIETPLPRLILPAQRVIDLVIYRLSVHFYCLTDDTICVKDIVFRI